MVSPKKDTTIDTTATLTLSHVRVELPVFDPSDVDTWLVMCDNIMCDAGLRTQATMFRKCLAKLPPAYFRHVKHLATTTPLPATCYDLLKDCLRRRLQLTPTARWQRLKQLLPCSEGRPPSKVYADLEALYPKALTVRDTGYEIVCESFLECLPASLELVCREWLDSLPLAEVALRADAHHRGGQRAVAIVEDGSDEGATICTTAAVHRARPGRHGQASRFATDSNRRPKENNSSSNSGAYVERWCYIHRRYGPAARRCIEPCTFRSDVASGNASSNRQ